MSTLGIAALLGIALLTLFVIALLGIAWHWPAFRGIVLGCLALPWFALFGAVALICLAMVSVALLCLALICITFAMLCIAFRCIAWHRLALLDITWH